MASTLRYSVISAPGLYIGTTFYPTGSALLLTEAAARYLILAGSIQLGDAQAPPPTNPSNPTEDDIKIAVTIDGKTSYVTLTQFLDLFPSLKLKSADLDARFAALVGTADAAGDQLGKLEDRLEAIEDGLALQPNVVTGVCSQLVLGQHIVRSTNSGFLAASSNNIADAGFVVGLSLATVRAGDQLRVQTSGTCSDPAWNFPVGPLWLGHDGTIISDAPITGFIQQIGVAISSTQIVLGLEDPIILG